MSTAASSTLLATPQNPMPLTTGLMAMLYPLPEMPPFICLHKSLISQDQGETPPHLGRPLPASSQVHSSSTQNEWDMHQPLRADVLPGR